MLVESAVYKGNVFEAVESAKPKQPVPASITVDYIRGGLSNPQEKKGYFKREGQTTIVYGPWMIVVGEKHITKYEPNKTTQLDFPYTRMGGFGVPIKSGRLTFFPNVMYGQTGMDATLQNQTPLGTAVTRVTGEGDYGTLGISANYSLNDPRQTVIFGSFSTGKGTIQAHQNQTILNGSHLPTSRPIDSICEVGGSGYTIGGSQSIAGTPGKPGDIRAIFYFRSKQDWVKYLNQTSASEYTTYGLGLEWKATEDISIGGGVNYSRFRVPGMEGNQNPNNLDYNVGIKIKL